MCGRQRVPLRVNHVADQADGRRERIPGPFRRDSSPSDTGRTLPHQRDRQRRANNGLVYLFARHLSYVGAELTRFA